MLVVVLSNENVRDTVAVNFHVKENYGSIKKKTNKKTEKEVMREVVCPQILFV